MSILICGMEMPTTCCHCPLIGYDPYIEWNDGGIETQGAYICVITHEIIYNTKREDHCPLVPVPPHGRLIDGDAFLALINDSTILSDFLKCIIKPLIRGEPTVIEAEEGET